MYAVADATVEEIGFDARLGNYLFLRLTDGSRVRYGQLSEITVTEGQELQAGESIAALGASGTATDPNLSLALQENGAYVNPLKTE